MDSMIRAEWDPLRTVVVHKPGFEVFFGLLDPHGSLYERAFSRTGARTEHEILTRVLEKEFGVSVLFLKRALIEAATQHAEIKQKLVDKAREVLEFSGDAEHVKFARREFELNCKYYDVAHFFNILLLNPKVNIDKRDGVRNIAHEIVQRQPLANLFYMRDQQFVTDRGIVLCRMAKPTRRRETEITKFLWKEVLGLPILHEMRDPAIIEGGEFLPMGNFALVGVGDRTNLAAIDQLLSLPLEYEEIGVVHQPMHPALSSSHPDPMINMHLDTYFNVAAKNVVVGSRLLLQVAQVDVYHNRGNGKFEKDPAPTTLYNYIIGKGFHLIELTTLEQMSYASNFLCIRDREIVAIEVEPIARKVLADLRRRKEQHPEKYARLLAQVEEDFAFLSGEGQFFPHKKEIYQNDIRVYPLNLKNLTGGYGGAHCMTCAISRGKKGA